MIIKYTQVVEMMVLYGNLKHLVKTIIVRHIQVDLGLQEDILAIQDLQNDMIEGESWLMQKVIITCLLIYGLTVFTLGRKQYHLQGEVLLMVVLHTG